MEAWSLIGGVVFMEAWSLIGGVDSWRPSAYEECKPVPIKTSMIYTSSIKYCFIIILCKVMIKAISICYQIFNILGVVSRKPTCVQIRSLIASFAFAAFRFASPLHALSHNHLCYRLNVDKGQAGHCPLFPYIFLFLCSKKPIAFS